MSDDKYNPNDLNWTSPFGFTKKEFLMQLI